MIKEFSGEYRWLSNFFPCLIIMGDLTYPSVENAYQAAKYPVKDRLVFTTCSPAKAKRLGSSIKVPHGWEDNKISLMRRLNKQKYQHGNYLRVMLVNTGEQELIEGNTWDDTFWGECDGVGENNLGKILMEIREETFGMSNRMAHGQ